VSRFGYSIYDSLVIAVALEAGCTTLLSEGLHAGQAIDGLTIRNPVAGALVGKRRR
jgi:predicted nucleic acid-binding protein